MDIHPKNISPLGYQTGMGGIDSYGVNHNGFTNQDEIAYQMARSSREQDLIKQYNAQGITSNYPQYTTNFWGNPANNYGFGNSNIEANIANLPQTTPIPVATAIPQQPVQPEYWETAEEGKQVYDNIIRNEGNYQPQEQNMLDYGISAIKAVPNMLNNYINLKNVKLADKYKHAFMNCNASQYGQGGADVAELASNIRETYDRTTGANTLDSSMGDQYANMIGRLLGSKYPNGDCSELIQKYIKRKY